MADKQYIIDNFVLMAEWNWERNTDFPPANITSGCHKKVWWRCSKGHEWQAVIASRSKGNGCPYCAGQKVLKGYNDLQTINPFLAAQWNYKKNDGVTPTDVMPNSGKKAWWKCDKGHEWQAVIASRSKGNGCPYCAGQKVLKGYNDLQTINPILASEWNYEKNGDLTPADVMPGSEKKLWWRCNKGHEWDALVSDRTNGRGCPYCSGKRVLKGFNDLQTVNPKLASDWDFDRNGSLAPDSVTAKSGKKVWWKCEKGHRWQSVIAKRSEGNGCPYCGSQKVLKGYNDLLTINPTLAEDWNYKRNNGLTPADVMSHSNQKVWWQCNKGHEWQAIIANRVKGNGCPVCSSEQRTSFPEYAIVYYLEQAGLKVIHSYHEQGYELDIYIPSKKIAIEYDGYFWHKNTAQKDINKNRKCKKDGIKLYRLREGLPSLNDSSIDVLVQIYQTDLVEKLRKVLSEIIEKIVDIDLERDAIAIYNLREHLDKENSLQKVNPQIAKEWHYEKNGRLTPENCTVNSGKRVWWKCSNGHEWKATISNRNRGSGCPYCSRKKAIRGYNDLQTLNPTLAQEWNYEKNNGLAPADLLPSSNKKAWWRCQKGHEWQATVNSRNNGCGCPYCAGRFVVQGYSDLQTLNPKLASEWNYDKNGKLKPENFMVSSGKKVWWKCMQGHEWSATINHRNAGKGCPYCAGQKVFKGYNDLQTLNSSLAGEWHPEKNGILTPENVTANSGRKVWWKCTKGHEWQAIIANRNRGRGCPYCAGRKKQSRI